MMNICYRSVQPDDYEKVRKFFIVVGWDHRVADSSQFELMIRNADRTVVAWSDDRIVGFGRALCDDVSNGYLSLIAVAPDMRGRGIGREIVHRLIGDDPRVTWVLRAGRESSAFWKRMGFSRSEIAMERTRSL